MHAGSTLALGGSGYMMLAVLGRNLASSPAHTMELVGTMLVAILLMWEFTAALVSCLELVPQHMTVCTVSI